MRKSLSVLFIFFIASFVFASDWYVCFGAFDEKSKAETRVTELEKIGVPASVVDYDKMEGNKIYRVFFSEKYSTSQMAEFHKSLMLKSPEILKIVDKDLWISEVVQISEEEYNLNKSRTEYVAERKFQEIADKGNGVISCSFGANELGENLYYAVNDLVSEDNVEIVFAIDATGSMDDDFYELYYNWLPKFKEQVQEFKNVKFGLILYKDYEDEYNFKDLPVKYYGFTQSVEKLAEWISSAYISGGGDTPEAVYEALYASLEFFDWSPDAKKKIILIGDAEPHPFPRGKMEISQDSVVQLAKEKNIVFDCIIIMPESARTYYPDKSVKSKIREIDESKTVDAIIESVEDAK